MYPLSSIISSCVSRQWQTWIMPFSCASHSLKSVDSQSGSFESNAFSVCTLLYADDPTSCLSPTEGPDQHNLNDKKRNGQGAATRMAGRVELEELDDLELQQGL